MNDDLIAEALTEHWGPRCKTKDTDDFPELVDALLAGRCPCCLAWEQYDRLRAEVERLTAALSDERAHADALAGALAEATDDLDTWVSLRDDLIRSGYDVDYSAAVSKRGGAALAQHRARRQG